MRFVTFGVIELEVGVGTTPIAFGNQTICQGGWRASLTLADSRRCVPASQQVCLSRVQSSSF